MTAAQESLVHRFLPMVRHLAWTMASHIPPGVTEEDDLYQAGVIGLIQAAKSFDPARGLRFATHATWRVRGAMLDHLRDLDWVPRLARQRGEDVPRWLALPEGGVADHSDPTEGIRREDFWLEVTRGMIPVEREVIRLSYREGIPLWKIGAMLGFCEVNAGQIRRRALAHLRGRIINGCELL